ncbi:MAG: sigma 54-interacting transcriptional regulator [Acidobacteriota bacterium]
MRLVALSGPLSGSTFALEAQAVSIGRDRSNGLHLRDLAVSRHHCILEPGETGWRLRDLESLHGTFVNGVPVRERDLRPGDRIAVGSTLLLLQDNGESPGPPAALLDDEPRWHESTTHLTLDGSTYLGTGSLPADDRTTRDLQALLRIGINLHALHTTASLARRLLELTLETVPGQRTALLLLDRGAEEPTCFHLHRRGSTDPFQVSRTLVQRVVEERSAALANDVLHLPDLSEAESLLASRVRSLLAAPLPGPDGLLGILYLDTRDEDVLFDEGHLEVVTAIAGIAAAALASTRHMEWLDEERQRLESALDRDMVGESPRMKEVWRLLTRVAPTDTTVLLLGESGTGKELAARALHRSSPRSHRPFVAINCATLSETLLESELFGHERGAFTGAVERKTGKLEAADSGTLFLDEVGELPLPLQAKLLRVLQEREFERLGSTRTIRVDVRVIAATNRDLEKEIREGTFRDDLYYRLNVISLTLPPLRDRREDVPLLASHFAARFSRKLGRQVAGFTPEARACLLRYPWPGNIRELANAVERALVLGQDDLIRPEDLPEAVLESAPGTGARVPVARYHDAVNESKKRLILSAVEQAEGNITRAAEILGLHPNYLHRLISNLGLRERIRV